eukprot:4499833-Alexandrium_andersonii.AAC.1
MEQPSRTGSRSQAAVQGAAVFGRAFRSSGGSRGTSSACCSSSAPAPASWPTAGRRRSAGARRPGTQ